MPPRRSYPSLPPEDNVTGPQPRMRLPLQPSIRPEFADFIGRRAVLGLHLDGLRLAVHAHHPRPRSRLVAAQVKVLVKLTARFLALREQVASH